MEQGKFAYKANLESARKALLDQGDTDFVSLDAGQLAQKARQGLVRPRARDTGGDSEGFGMGIMKAMQQKKVSRQEELAEEQYSAPQESVRPQARKGSVSPSDMDSREMLALTLQAEAAGEGYDGMVAAGAVIRNRAQSGKYGKGIKGVIMKPGQFSAWNGVTGYAGGKGAIDMDNLRASKAAYAAADALLSGNYEDKTGGATHYYNPKVATPKWGSNAGGKWKDIGNHRFGFGDGNPGST